MKISKQDIKIFLLCFFGFIILCFVIYYSQQKKYESLIKDGRYTLGIGEKISQDRTGWTFIYNYKVNNKVYEGRNSATGIREEFAVGGIYFVVFDPNKPRKNFLIKYPPVPAEMNFDSIPLEGWSELPVPVHKDSIRNFLD